MPNTLLKVTCHNAERLKAVNSDHKTSDPFCVVTYGDLRWKTKTRKGTVNPSWNETHNFQIDDTPDGLEKALVVSIYDDTVGIVDKFTKQKVRLGEVVIKLARIEHGPTNAGYARVEPQWYDVKDGSAASGRISLSIEWINPHPEVTKSICSRNSAGSLSSSTGSGIQLLKSSDGSGTASPAASRRVSDIGATRQFSTVSEIVSELDSVEQELCEDESGFVYETCTMLSEKISLITENVGGVASQAFGFDSNDDAEKKAAKVFTACQMLVDKAGLDGELSYLSEQTKSMMSMLIGAGEFISVIGKCAPYCSVAGVLVGKIVEIAKTVSLNKKSCVTLSNEVTYLKKICENLQIVFTSKNVATSKDKGVMESLAHLVTLMLKTQAVCRQTLIAVNEWTTKEKSLVKKAVKYVFKSSGFKTRLELCSENLEEVRSNLDFALQVTQTALIADVAGSLSDVSKQLADAPLALTDASKNDMRDIMQDLKSSMQNSEQRVLAALAEQNVTNDDMMKRIEKQCEAIMMHLSELKTHQAEMKKSQDEMHRKIDVLLAAQHAPNAQQHQQQLTVEQRQKITSLAASLPSDVTKKIYDMISAHQSFADIVMFVLTSKEKALLLAEQAEKQRTEEEIRKRSTAIAALTATEKQAAVKKSISKLSIAEISRFTTEIQASNIVKKKSSYVNEQYPSWDAIAQACRSQVAVDRLKAAGYIP